MPIFDQGYQHWQGRLSGHTWRWLAITRQGVRAHLKNRLLRVLLLLAWVPAIALCVVLALWGLVEQQAESVLGVLRQLLPLDMIAEPRAYRVAVWTIAYSFFFKFEMFFAMFLVMIVGPGLISQDLRFNAFPLYFSRPLRRIDYFLGKLGVIAALLGAVAVVPAVIAYVLGVCFSLDLGVVKDTYRLLFASIAFGAIIVFSAGTLMLALSSLSRRSIYVGITWAGFWFVSAGVGGILVVSHEEMTRWEAERIRQAEYQALQREYPNFKPWERKNDPNDKTARQRYEAMNARLLDRIEKERAEAAPTNWRPMVSYTTNLDRFADLLMDTDSAWVTIGKAAEAPRAMVGRAFGPGRGASFGPEPPRNERRLADQFVLQYPWYWSAAVLAALLGISVWILTTRVKSLDRLR